MKNLNQRSLLTWACLAAGSLFVGFGPSWALEPISIRRLVLWEVGFMLNPNSKNTNSSFGFDLFSYERIFTEGFGIQLSPFNLYVWNGHVEEGPFTETVNTFSGAIHTRTYTRGRTANILNCTPLSIRHYLQYGPERLQPFLGVGLTYHLFNIDSVEGKKKLERRWGPSFEIGVATSKAYVPRTRLVLKIFPGSSTQFDHTLYALSVGHSIGWREKKE